MHWSKKMALARAFEELDELTIVDLERVRRVQSRLTNERTLQLLAETFAALADTTRLRIIEALAQEELCVGDLSSALGLSQSCTSHHLRTLATCGWSSTGARGGSSTTHWMMPTS